LFPKNTLELVININRSLNCEIINIMKSIKNVFQSLETATDLTLQLVAPSDYLLLQKMRPVPRESKVMQMFKKRP